MLDRNDTLLAVLRRTQLLAPDQVEQVATELVPDFPDPLALGQYLVEIDWLTPYQLQLLLSGQWDELVIGHYQVLDRLGEGGVSEVFRAWDTRHGREVALKVLRQHLSVNRDMVRQFRIEAEAIIRLSHPNIIRTLDAGESGPFHYLAMELVEGMDLERYVQQVGPLPVEQACDYARQAAQGLQHAHQFGLVHRDIKPANLFLLHPPLADGKRGPDPVVKIIDWGLARCARPESGLLVPSPSQLGREKGRLLGTADYMAPEQIEDATLVDIRADIYSLGCVLFYLLTGAPPFAGGSVMQKVVQHQEATPPPLRTARPDVSEELEALVHQMLLKSPRNRPQLPLLVVAALRRFLSGQRPGSAQGGALRPGTSTGTALNLPRPATHSTLNRPETHTRLNRPTQ